MPKTCADAATHTANGCSSIPRSPHSVKRGPTRILKLWAPATWRPCRHPRDPGGHVYAARTENDIIGAAGGTSQWTLGPEPDKQSFGAIHLQADPGPSWPLGLPSIDAHSSYSSPENPALANMGSIIAGKPPPFVVGQR